MELVPLRQHRKTPYSCSCALRPESHGARKKTECDHPGIAVMSSTSDGKNIYHTCHACGKDWKEVT